MERPASLDRLAVKKSKKQIWLEEGLAEIRYLTSKKNQKDRDSNRVNSNQKGNCLHDED